MRWHRLLTDESGFLNFLIPGVTGLLGLLKKPGVQAGAQAVGQLVGGIAGGRAQGKQADISNQQSQAELQQRLFETLSRNAQAQGQLGAQRAQFERDSPDVRFRQALRGNLAANVQDVTANVPDRLKPYMVNFSGGLRPSALGAGGRAAGQQLAALASARMGQDTFQFPQMPQAPQLPNLPKANWLDKLLGVAGPAAGVIGLMGPALGRPTPPLDTPPLQSPGLYNDLFRFPGPFNG